MSDLTGQRCLVLGAGGFIGTNLCNALVRRGAVVQAFGRSRQYPLAFDRSVQWWQGEFRDTLALAKAVEAQDFVFHLISGSTPENSNHDPAGDLEGNVVATIRLLELCQREKVRKVIFASSGGTVYGIPDTVPIAETCPTNPISSYGIGKLAIEKYLHLFHHLHGLDYLALRMANPYGPFQSAHRKQGVVGAMIRQALSGQTLEIWGTGEVVRDFLHIDDIMAAMLAGCLYQGEARVMNVGSGHGLSINQIVHDIQVAVGHDLPIRYRAGRAADVPVNILDSTLIRHELGWQPRIAWVDGLRQTVEWMRQQMSASGDTP